MVTRCVSLMTASAAKDMAKSSIVATVPPCRTPGTWQKAASGAKESMIVLPSLSTPSRYPESAIANGLVSIRSGPLASASNRRISC